MRRVPVLAVFLVLGTAATAFPDDRSSMTESATQLLKEWPTYEDQIRPRIPPLHYVPKTPGHYSAEDWQAVIDSTWGPGLPTAQKLSLYTDFWNDLDWEFPSFQVLDTALWDSIWLADSSEIADSVSRGRFSAVLNHSAMALREPHVTAGDTVVSRTQLLPGVPLLYMGGWGLSSHFGAGLTPMADSSLLVYDAVPAHPLGLVPGDLVLGYDGIPWRILFQELLDARLPMVDLWNGGSHHGSSPPSFTHSWLISAGLNWHLFDSIDVVKYGTDDTVRLATSVMVGQDLPFFASEQLAVAGVPRPHPQGEHVTWGVMDNSRIGYVYVISWGFPAIETSFQNAIQALTVDSQVTGLIVDFRRNGGGFPPFAHGGFGFLFADTLDELYTVRRLDPNDHLSLVEDTDPGVADFTVYTDSSTYFDRPIALLTGPGAISAGDINALQISFHPRVKVFGKPTTGAFSNTAPKGVTNDILRRTSQRQAVRDSVPLHYLAHDVFPSAASFPWVDYEEVWLTRDGAANGIDDVVEAAKAWILSRDLDQDGIVNELDNCQLVTNPDQGITINMAGDVNLSTSLTSADIIYMVNYVFKSQAPPLPCEAAGDVNCSGAVTSADIIYMVNHIFKGDAPPCEICQAVGLGWSCP